MLKSRYIESQHFQASWNLVGTPTVGNSSPGTVHNAPQDRNLKIYISESGCVLNKDISFRNVIA